MAQVHLTSYSIVVELFRLKEFLHPLNKFSLLAGGRPSLGCEILFERSNRHFGQRSILVVLLDFCLMIPRATTFSLYFLRRGSGFVCCVSLCGSFRQRAFWSIGGYYVVLFVQFVRPGENVVASALEKDCQ